MVVENKESQRDLFKKALVDTVKLIKEERSVEDVTTISTITTIPSILTSIESQMAMLSVSEKIRNIPLVNELIIEEITSKHETSIPLLGFRALRTAIENHPINVESEVLDYLDTQDLDQDKVQEKLAAVLNVAHTAREQVIGRG